MGESRQHVRARWFGTLGLALLGAVVITGGVRPVGATMKYGAVQLSGNFETQNLIRDQQWDKFQLVQNRNTFRLRVDWDWLQNGKFVDKFDIPFIERSKLYLLYRGVYDGFYNITPGGNQVGQTRFDDLIGGPIAGNNSVNPSGRLRNGLYSRFDDSARSAAAYENRLREAYIDLKLKDAPLSFRLGRQQIIWGESDQFRIMDIWNPLDTTWHFQQESWDNIRIPQWVAKGLWDIGELGPFSNTFMEVVYNPFDFQSGGKVAFLPQPWGVPIADPLRPGQVQYALPNSSFPLVTPVFHMQGTSYQHGDFGRNPQDASEVGARLHGVTPQGLELSLDYIYGRGRGVGAANPNALVIQKIQFRGLNPIPFAVADPSFGTFGGQPVAPADVTAKLVYPYMHIFGLTGNISEEDYLGAVLRFETAYAMGEPHQTVADDKRVIIQDANGEPVFNADGSEARAPLGYEKRDIWAGMIGFDRPTWIRWLNPKATWFVTGQFFWHYTTGANVDLLRGPVSPAAQLPYTNNPTDGSGGPVFAGVAANGMGQWNSGPFAGRMERLQDGAALGSSDKVHQWEHLVTLAATSFYRGGTIVPFVADAWDPVDMNNEFLWNIDYFYSNDLIFSVQQKLFSALGRNIPSNDPWFAAGRFTRRDETGIKVTYQF